MPLPSYQMNYLHSTGFQIWPLPMLFLNSLRNNIFWKNICKGFCSCKSQRNAKFDILHWQKWVPDVSPLWNVKFRMPLTFTAAKVFVNIFSRKYYFTNNLKITLAGAKFWTLCCANTYLISVWLLWNSSLFNLLHFIIVWSCGHYYKVWQLLGSTPHCWLNAKPLLHTAYTQTLFLFSQTIFLLSCFLICSFFHILSSYLLISDSSDSRIISHWRISGLYLIGW